jgi:hypothetical protein
MELPLFGGRLIVTKQGVQDAQTKEPQRAPAPDLVNAVKVALRPKSDAPEPMGGGDMGGMGGMGM